MISRFELAKKIVEVAGGLRFPMDLTPLSYQNFYDYYKEVCKYAGVEPEPLPKNTQELIKLGEAIGISGG